jgi:ribosomal protein S8
MTDPIADMLTRIRNATVPRRKRVDVPASRLKAEVARILQCEGYIHSYKMVDVVGDVSILAGITCHTCWPELGPAFSRRREV